MGRVYVPIVRQGMIDPGGQGDGMANGLGVGIPWQNAETDPGYYDRALGLLEPPFWYNWKFDKIGASRYVPMCWKCAPGTMLDQAIAAAKADRALRPTQTWLMGNEPELPPEHKQSDTNPADYKTAALKWVQNVGGFWVGPNILWHEQGREWIRNYVRIGGPIPSAWGIHIYFSATPAQWAATYNEAKSFFAGLGVPRVIWVTETAVAGGAVSTQKTLLDWLMRQRDFKAFWYSSHDPFGPWREADLMDLPNRVTIPLGYHYASYQLSLLSDGSSEPITPGTA